MSDSTQRFSSRVADYVKYRPDYPAVIVELLREECGLTNEAVIVDVGSGTGILSELFLRNGNIVFGVEPNAEMRTAGEQALIGYPNFHSIAATAEATTLPDRCADFVTAGQAFHWFDMVRTREEWLRILKPKGWAVLVWNDRLLGGTPFLEGYEQLLWRYGTDYKQVTHKQIDDALLHSFFRPEGFNVRSFPNEQIFDFEGLKGRLLSSSYTPERGHPNYEPMLEALQTLFDREQEDGVVRIKYDTRIYYGQLTGGKDGASPR